MVSICRLCASLKKTENLTFIRDGNHDLCLKLAKCCQLHIDLKDSLPRGVCPECIRSLNVSFDFYERVHESQQSLEKLLNVQTSSKEALADGEQKSLFLIAAAASTDSNQSSLEAPLAGNDDGEELPAVENENDSDVARVINEILGVKEEEQTAYIVINSESEEGRSSTEKSEPAAAKSDEEMNANTEQMFSPDPYAGIEFIEEDEEEIDFENNHFEIIEEEDDAMAMEYDAEEKTMEEPEVYGSTTLPETDGSQDSWVEYTWKCVRCQEVFYSAKQLIEHNLRAHQVRATEIEWLCADCQKTFPRYYTLVNHIRQRHRTHLALLCDVCNESCKSFQELEEHRREAHRDEDNPVMLLCVTCGKGFHTTNSLQIHSKCHLPDDMRLRYSCNLCTKKFRTTSNLKFHQKMHAGTRDFVCDQCGKKFVQRANLEEHLVTHVTFTPYECSLCQKLFKTPERLTRHKQRHTDDKPFSCKECDKTFRTKDAMNTHMRIHTGEMPFSCEFCKKPFRFRSTLMTHHNVHTGTRPYSCVDCDHHFTNWPNYNKHMKRRHGIDVSSKNPRGKKPSNPPKPLKKPKTTTTVTRPRYFVKIGTDQDFREGERKEMEEDDDGEDITGEYEPEVEINVALSKQERETLGDNYEDAI